MHPDEYIRLHYLKCPYNCGGTLAVDKTRKEGRDRGVTCRCDNWWFPHRKTNECPDMRDVYENN